MLAALLLAASLLEAAVTATAAPAVSSPAPCLDEAPPPGPQRAFHLFPAAFDFGPPTQSPSITTPAAKPKKRFWAAAAQVVGLNVFMWASDKYLLKAPFANISLARWKLNLKTGFVYDRDDFPTNQAEHPFNGSFYYAAARSNGFNLWESALFTAAGSLMWEFFGENEPASWNDFVNTTVGGVTQGEIFHRVSMMLLDNTASGSSRFWREIGAFVVNPTGGLNRLLRGEMTKDFPNPDDRLPARFFVEVAAGYQHSADGSAAVVRYPNQSLIGILVRYGDPFVGENRQPFDYFEALVELAPPSGKNNIATRWLERGQLFLWELPRSKSSEHRIGLYLNYDYLNNQAQVFSAQNVSANFLSRFPLRRGMDVRTEVDAVFFPLSAMQTDYTAEDIALVGRPYDYGLGGGVRVAARLRREELDLLVVNYQVLWMSTTNGVSVRSSIQSFNAQGQWPLARAFALGAGFTWNKRISSYFQRPTVRVAGPQWRVFGALLLR
jgi:hypothetical protein